MDTVLAKESIKLDYDAADWRAAVTKAGQLLQKAGVVEASYIQDMVEMVEKNGPYMVVAPGVAMPHAFSHENVNRTGVSFLRLRTPVVFPRKEDNPILLLIGVASKDNRVHLDLMGDVAAVIADKDSLSKIKQMQDTEEIYRILNGIKIQE